MKFSRESIEMLLDLIEIKISNIIVQDRDDTKELKRLKQCKSEVQKLLDMGTKVKENTKRKVC